MSRTTKTITLSLPPETVKQVEKLTKTEGRTRSELFREALRRYVEEKEWKELYLYGERKTREKGIRVEQVEKFIDARRR